MTGDSRKTREIATAEREQDELMEWPGIHSEEYKAIVREAKNLNIERKAEILGGW